MRRWILILPVLLLGVVVWALFSGADADIAARAAAWQRGFQNDMAGALRALRAGEPGAVTALLGLCFAYGVVHAVGPGHGKVLIGGYGLGARVPALRLSLTAIAASLMQAVTAIVLVYAGMTILGWGRAQMTGLAEGAFATVSALAIGLVGAWLLLRGARRLMRAPRHDHGPDCDHRHGPTAAEVAAAHNWRETLMLIGSIGIRPCSGALFLLLVTWHMGIAVAGIAGAVAMALGTALVTVAAAVAAVTARESAFVALADGSGRLARLLPLLEIAAGGLVILVALRLLD